MGAKPRQSTLAAALSHLWEHRDHPLYDMSEEKGSRWPACGKACKIQCAALDENFAAHSRSQTCCVLHSKWLTGLLSLIFSLKMSFRVARAIVRQLPTSFAANAVRSNPALTISQHVAEQQHSAFTAALRAAVPTVIELPALDSHPDSCFVEDTAIIVGGTALVMRPGHDSRLEEAAAMEKELRKLPDLRVVTMKPASSRGDGGDVLWTGREFFVGVGSRTNMGTVEALRGAFPGIRCTAVQMEGGRHSGRKVKLGAEGASSSSSPLHLKSFCSMVAPGLLGVAQSHTSAAASFLSSTDRLGGSRHTAAPQVLPMFDCTAANVVQVNDTLICQPGPAEELLRALVRSRGLPLQVVAVDTSELGKADGLLTCCGLLFNEVTPLPHLQQLER